MVISLYHRVKFLTIIMSPLANVTKLSHHVRSTLTSIQLLTAADPIDRVLSCRVRQQSEDTLNELNEEALDSMAMLQAPSCKKSFQLVVN